MRASFHFGLLFAAVVASAGCGGPDASRGNSRDADAPSSSQPPEVPGDYVPTPNGYFHPSCIVALEPDEVLGPDRVVRGMGGSPRRTIPACAHPRFTTSGRVIAPETSDGGLGEAGAADAGAAGSDGGGAPYYDGWLVSYYSNDPPADPALTLTGKWVVPPIPTSGALSGNNQLQVFFFNGIGTSAQIVQPVLAYFGGSWNIESVTCCGGGGLTARGAVIPVSPGDVIEGITAGNNCDVASDICQGWTVTTRDLTTGQSSVLNAPALNAPPTYVASAVLETLGLDACDMLPPGGEETFLDTTLTAGDAGAQSLKYDLVLLPEPGAPACGYRGISSGNSYTLIYSSGALGYATTTTSLSATASGTFAGAVVALAAAVTSTATNPPMEGTVSFYDGTTLLAVVDAAAATDASGHTTASAALSLALPGGVHTLTAAYGGSFNYGSSTSAASTVALAGWPTSTTLDASPPTSTEGTPSRLVATVTSTTPSTLPALGGTVHFYDGSAAIGSASLASPSDGGSSPLVAILDVPTLLVGSNSLTASYDGDAYHAASSSAPSVLTVTSSLALTPVAATAPPRGSIVFTAAAGVSPIAWALATNASGATLSAASGENVTYVAGAAGGADVVVATDGAGATAAATVTVGAGVSLTPSSASISTGGAIAFSASGGSGADFAWSLKAAPSGGSIDGSSGAYRAGAIGGVTDVVAVTDPLGNVATAPINVLTSQDAGTESDAGKDIPPAGGGAGCACGTVPSGASQECPGAAGALVLALAAMRRRARTQKP